VHKRWNGLKLLRRRLGDNVLDYKPFGGYELFLEENTDGYEECLCKLPFVNDVLRPLFKSDVFNKEIDRFAFKGLQEYLVFNPFEGQVDTGNMMQALLKQANAHNIHILNSHAVTGWHEQTDHVQVNIGGFAFNTKKLLFATNGFAEELTDKAVR